MMRRAYIGIFLIAVLIPSVGWGQARYPAKKAVWSGRAARVQPAGFHAGCECAAPVGHWEEPVPCGGCGHCGHCCLPIIPAILNEIDCLLKCIFHCPHCHTGACGHHGARGLWSGYDACCNDYGPGPYNPLPGELMPLQPATPQIDDMQPPVPPQDVRSYRMRNAPYRNRPLPASTHFRSKRSSSAVPRRRSNTAQHQPPQRSVVTRRIGSMPLAAPKTSNRRISTQREASRATPRMLEIDSARPLKALEAADEDRTPPTIRRTDYQAPQREKAGRVPHNPLRD